MNLAIGIVVILCGLFTLGGGALNWDFFMNNRRAQKLSRIITQNGARIFYCLLGSILIYIGILIFTGEIDLASEIANEMGK